MANIIDETYFENGNLYIPNNKEINTDPVDSPTVITELGSFISKYERELLLNALGVNLYDELQVALALPDFQNADQKWIDLVEGTNYTNADGNVKRWDGLRGYNKQSLIAFYIFTEYLRNDNETYTTTGVVRNLPKNAELVGSTPKFIKAYNQFIEMYQGKLYATQPIVVINGFGSLGLDWQGVESVQVSLFQYLTDANVIDPLAFPDFEFRFYERQNSFGI